MIEKVLKSSELFAPGNIKRLSDAAACAGLVLGCVSNVGLPDGMMRVTFLPLSAFEMRRT